MAGEMNGEIFDISLATSVDTSEIDKLGKAIDEYDNKNINIVLNPQWTKSAEKTINKFKDTAVTMNVKLDIPDDLKKTTSQLSRLATVMERLSNYSGKNRTVSVSPIAESDVSQTAPSRSETKAIEASAKDLEEYAERFNDVIGRYAAAKKQLIKQIEAVKNEEYVSEDMTPDESLKTMLDDIKTTVDSYKDAFSKVRMLNSEILNNDSIKIDDGAMSIIKDDNLFNFDSKKWSDDLEGKVSEYLEDAIKSINQGIEDGIYDGIPNNKGGFRDIKYSDFGINFSLPKSQTESIVSNKTNGIPLSQTVPIDMSALAGTMSLSFDNKDISSIKTSVGNIETSVRNISTSLQGGIPISGASQSGSNKKPESIKLDASNLITALGNLKNSIDAKEAIIEKDANSKRIIQDNSKAQVTVEQLNAAIADSESKLNAEAARNKTIYNGIYTKMQTLVDGLKAENKEIYDNLGKNFLDVSDEQLDSFIEKLESLQENYKINIDVDIPNLDNFKAMYLTLDKAERLEKASKKDTTKKSKTKAITPSVAKKEESATVPVAAEVKLPENLDLLDKESKEALDDIKTAVQIIDGKIKESSEVDKSKSKPKAKTAKKPEQAGAKSLLTSALSDAIGDIRTTNSSIDENVKQASASTDLIFEDVDETKQDIKEAKAIINGIYNKISNGVTVTGGVSIPSSNNSPTPIPQGNNGGTPRNRGGNNPKPVNTPSASIRSRDNIIDETNRLLPEIDSEIKKINYLLDSEGGVSDAILSKDDAKDLLNRLKEVESEISNIQNAVWSKKVGQKTLAAADSDLADVMSTYSSINIPQEVDTYNKVFGDSKSIRRAKEMLGTLTRFKELLNTKGIDTTAYDEAIQRLEDGIERVEETKKSWMSQKLDGSGLKLANDALTQVRDSLDGVSDATESLFEYAKNEKSEFLSFDVKIDEVEELEKSLIRLDKLIKKAKFSGVDLASVDMGNGQTLADAEKTIERYFSEKDSLSIYSPGQFASEDEFKSYREDIELNLIQPTKLYAKTLGETEYAVNQLIQEQKELTKASNEYNKGLTLNKQISNKITELEKWRDANSKAFTIPENAAEYERFMNRLKDGTIIDQSQMKKFNAEWAEFNAQIRAAGQNGKTTGSILTAMFKKFGGWTLVTRTITQGLRLMKDMVTQVKEVDTAMVNLRKVTDASEQSLLKYQKSVQKSSIALGTTLTDQIDSTATFSRLGYQLEEAQKLGEVASKYKTVAEDLDINTASESIISTMKAYQSMGDTAEEIVDKFNYVGKELPLITISVKGQRCSRPR